MLVVAIFHLSITSMIHDSIMPSQVFSVVELVSSFFIQSCCLYPPQQNLPLMLSSHFPQSSIRQPIEACRSSFVSFFGSSDLIAYIVSSCLTYFSTEAAPMSPNLCKAFFMLYWVITTLAARQCYCITKFCMSKYSCFCIHI